MRLGGSRLTDPKARIKKVKVLKIATHPKNDALSPFICLYFYELLEMLRSNFFSVTKRGKNEKVGL